MSQITFSPSNHNKKIIHFYVSIFCFVSSGQVCKSLIIVIWPQKKPAVEQQTSSDGEGWCAATVWRVHWRMGSWVVKNPVISMPQSSFLGTKFSFGQQLRLWCFFTTIYLKPFLGERLLLLHFLCFRSLASASRVQLQWPHYDLINAALLRWCEARTGSDEPNNCNHFQKEAGISSRFLSPSRSRIQ